MVDVSTPEVVASEVTVAVSMIGGFTIIVNVRVVVTLNESVTVIVS
jgi:hypothetical protein